ncbi:MAG: hypothetical protein NTW14_14070 [bacterium]|nr:hypothetical protein [bacterium]
MPQLTEEQIRLIANLVKDELGSEATLEKMRQTVREVAERLERQGPVTYQPKPQGRLLAICLSPEAPRGSTVLAQALKDTGCEVVERFETSLGGTSILLALIDPSRCGRSFDEIRSRLADAGNAAQVRVILQAVDALK